MKDKIKKLKAMIAENDDKAMDYLVQIANEANSIAENEQLH